ncbi:hypothetical protein ACTRXD_09195 [Nitrospira sp. T9]|uniref:hypothetical protein n=1 Tax=unclassified Nitrospira TaxID=2652172 RepID=UPI003F99A114
MDNLLKIHHWLKTIEIQCVVPLAGTPKFISEKQVFEYSTVSVEVVAYLKAVRATQSLKSIRLLQENGLIIDLYTLVRCILDCVNEIYFLLETYPEVSQTVEKFLQNFRESTIDDLLEEGTEAVPSKKIRNASARVKAENGHTTFDQAKARLDRPYKIISGYVHSQYSHIMEIYGGHPKEHSFKIEGIASEKRKADYLIWIAELDEMVIHSLAYMAKHFSCEQVRREIIQHFENLESS